MSIIFSATVGNLQEFYQVIRTIKKEAGVRCALFCATSYALTIRLNPLMVDYDRNNDLPESYFELTHMVSNLKTRSSFKSDRSRPNLRQFFIALPEMDCAIYYEMKENKSMDMKIYEDKPDELHLEFPNGTTQILEIR